MSSPAIDAQQLSRPLRAAMELTGISETDLRDLFTSRQILIRLEDTLANVPDSRETFLLAVNQSLRFCPNVAIHVPPAAFELVSKCNALAADVYGNGREVRLVSSDGNLKFDAVVNVGTKVANTPGWITINSNGWIARIATAEAGAEHLNWESQAANPIGATAASCLGVGAAFFSLIGRPRKLATELCMFSHKAGLPGEMASAPPLPDSPLQLEAFLVGCGAVTNGWAYVIKRLPIRGKLNAIDRQSLRIENLGPYVASGQQWLGKPKVEVIKELLAPAIQVMTRPEEWELFKIRLQQGLTVPRVIVCGLDNVETRHSVQQLWPEVLIDMAAGGLTSQVIVNRRANDGLCLLRALARPTHEISWAQRLSLQTGLRRERIQSEPTTPINQADVEEAAPEFRSGLERARGQQICGRLTHQNLQLEDYDPDFAPAVPFVTTFSGVVGAAETVKWLMAHHHPHSLHYQRNFDSGHARALRMKCESSCECQRLTAIGTG